MSFALLAGLNALALICMYLYFKARIDRLLASEKLLDKLRGEAGRIVGEMIQNLNKITDQNITLIENKVNELGTILDTADKRILLMHKQVKKEDEAGKLYGKVRKTARGYREAAEAALVRQENPPGAAGGGKRGQRAVSAIAAPETGEAPPETETPDSSGFSAAGDIFSLYRMGLSPELIAKRLNLPAGEVRLMISLRGHKGKSRE